MEVAIYIVSSFSTSFALNFLVASNYIDNRKDKTERCKETGVDV